MPSTSAIVCCPKCSSKLMVSREAASRRTQCPKCDAVFRVSGLTSKETILPTPTLKPSTSSNSTLQPTDAVTDHLSARLQISPDSQKKRRVPKKSPKSGPDLHSVKKNKPMPKPSPDERAEERYDPFSLDEF